ELNEVSDELWDELEELLIQADVGIETTTALLERLRDRADDEGMKKPEAVERALREELVKCLKRAAEKATEAESASPLHVILIVGVNGVGKTTLIAKLANYYRQMGKQVMLGAGDTFRAAAIDQLKIWGERVGAGVISHQPGADPGAVAFDSMQASLSRGAQVLIFDTAGRLHTKFNLMEELKKVRNVISRQLPGAPHEVLLVIDATTGQNGLMQAETFSKAVDVSGVAIAKLDGTAKGGIVFAIADRLGLPIKYIGTGEKMDDLAEFDAEKFVEALFE
ncbi:MAG: signal recognition particle-docking protein FtsY, partial [Chloroflexi bacterium]|nr:signal recognition particle-docking protein FtsY [Chloroflexota bacterium]